MADEVKLYGVWGSPFSKRVEIVLKIKRVEYEYIEEDLYNKSPSLVKYNPVHKKIPVLSHNGNPIAKSIVILEYIDEACKSGTPILPEDPYQRAMTLFWDKFIDDKCIPVLWRTCRIPGEEQMKATEETNEALKAL